MLPRSVSGHTRSAYGQEDTMDSLLLMLCPVALLKLIKISGGAMGHPLAQLYPPSTNRSRTNGILRQVISVARETMESNGGKESM